MVAKKYQNYLTASLLLIAALFLSQPVNLITADLGRHIKNGQIIFQNPQVLYTNFYSYTFPDYPFINHHWGSGIIFYIIDQLFGFTGQSVVFIILSLLTIYIFFSLAKKYSSFEASFLVFLFALPAITYRTEIRPEVFSYLLLALFLWILIEYINNIRSSGKTLYLLPFLSLLWVNLHIYYIFGILLIFIFLFEQLISYSIFKQKNLSSIRNLTIVGLTSLGATLINPNFYNGALYPLRIFDNYGYRLLENQSIIFIDQIFPAHPVTPVIKSLIALLICSWLVQFYYAFKTKKLPNLSLFLISLIFLYLGFNAIRNSTIFALFTATISAINLHKLQFNYSLPTKLSCFLLIILFMPFFLLIVSPSYYLRLGTIYWGAPSDIKRPADFFIRNNLSGPIFNNYDIGGYLIYNLFPQENVFTDNRPEGYPKEFFQNIYIPMQENEDVWKLNLKKYNFNTIFFYRHDLTPWAQKFLISRINDRDNWVPVFVDSHTIIFVRNNDLNKEIIKKYQLPRELFQVKK